MKFPERYRTDGEYGKAGRFACTNEGHFLLIIASTGCGWDHVSVVSKKLPTWWDLEYVKQLFWGPEEWVVQFHAPKSLHVNTHDKCMHLWKPTMVEMPTPPTILV